MLESNPNPLQILQQKSKSNPKIKSTQGMTNGIRAFVTNKNPTLFLAQEQQTFYASMCTNAEFLYFMFVM